MVAMVVCLCDRLREMDAVRSLFSTNGAEFGT